MTQAVCCFRKSKNGVFVDALKIKLRSSWDKSHDQTISGPDQMPILSRTIQVLPHLLIGQRRLKARPGMLYMF